jgi:outer membrane protein
VKITIRGVENTMNVKWMTAKRSTIWASASEATLQAAVEGLGQLARPTLAAFLAVLLAGSPVWAQDQQQKQPAPAPERPGLPASQTPGPGADKPGPTNPPIPVSLGVSKYNYTRAPRAFPNFIAPYRSIRVPEPVLTNSPRIDQLIHDGKLELTLQDAVELALENSMDIAVQRYYPWIADVSILKANAGSSGFGTPGAAISASSANLSPFAFSITSYDPLWTSSVFFDDRHTPINNPFISGTGITATAPAIGSHTAQYNNQYSQFFPTGTSLTVTYDNTRATSAPSANLFNPDVQSSLFVSFNQSLLSGFGLAVNHRNIIIAKNNRKIADLAFEQQAITTTTSAITAYWELAYARANVAVQEQAVATSTRLYGDNKKQLQIGTMAPLDVTRSEAQLANDQQNLIIAQTTKLQDEQVLKNFISKDPLAPNIINVEIIPTDKPTPPEATEAASFEESIKEAFQKRPELLEQDYNLKNAAVDVKATRNALLPTATLTGQYGSQGLSGNSPILTSTPAAGAPVVGSNAQPITVLDANGNPVMIFEPTTSTTTTGSTRNGIGTTTSQIFHNQFPDYAVGVSITIPIRNRSLQADNQRAILEQRLLQTQMQQLKNAAVVDVRNAFIALEQDRSQVATASEARKLQQETFDAEQKKYQLGASTVYNVILTQRDLVNAQGAELRALANLLEAKAQYERAVARTLDVNRVTIADAKHGEVEKDTLIPGTLHGKVVGTEDLLNLLPDGSSQK